MQLGAPARQARLPPTVVVGALRAGGSGKTSVTLTLARHFRSQGLHVAILAYWLNRPGLYWPGRGIIGPVLPGTSWRESSDEAVLLSEQSDCPVFVTRNRGRAWEELTKPVYYGNKPFDLILSDDGFQDPRLEKAFKILLIAPGEKPGIADLLPVGPFRQTLGTAKDADIVLEGPGIGPVASVNGFRRTLLFPPNFDFGQDYVVLSAMGNNAGFSEDLKRAGVCVVRAVEGRNHGIISKGKILSACRRHPQAGLLCSGKDWVKLREYGHDIPSVFLVNQRLDLPASLFAQLGKHLSIYKGATQDGVYIEVGRSR